MKARFKPYRSNAPCPACLDRNALNIVGRPAFINGVRLTAGCEICGGKGRVDEVERINGWPRPDIWIRKAYKPVVEDGG